MDHEEIIMDRSLAADTRLMYVILKHLSDEKGRVYMSTPEMGRYINSSRWPVSRRILPELVEHGLISRDPRVRPHITQLV